MMTKILGANWKTTVSAVGAALFSLLTVLAALPYEMGEVANIFPPEWKAKIALVSAAAALLLKVYNGIRQKDKSVTGGWKQQDLTGATVNNPDATLVGVTASQTPLEKMK